MNDDSFEFCFDKNSNVFEAQIEIPLHFQLDTSSKVEDTFDQLFLRLLKTLKLDMLMQEYIESKNKQEFFNAFIDTLYEMCTKKKETKTEAKKYQHQIEIF